MSNTFRVLRNSAFLLLSAFFFACENPTDLQIPGTGNEASSYFTDSLKLTLETYQMDSATTNQNVALVGSYIDPSFGAVTSTAYLQPTLMQESNPLTGVVSSISFDMDDNHIYDSLVLVLLNRDNVIFGDSLAKMTVNVHRLTEELPSKNYNYDSKIGYNPNPLASVTIDRSSLRTSNDSLPDFVRIRLPEAVAEELKKIEGTETGSDKDKFNRAFKGFALTVNAGANSVNVFNLGSISSSSTSVSALLYYVHEEGKTEALAYRFEFAAGRFNQISYNRSNTAIAKLTDKTQSIDIAETNGNTYIQASTGLATRIKFPELAQLGNILVQRAEMVFEADQSTFDPRFHKAPYVTFVEMEGNKIKRRNGDYVYVNTFGDATAGILTTYVDSTNKFVANITPYLQDLTSRGKPDNGIALVAAVPTSSGATSAFVYNSGLHRMVLKNYKLNLYYSKQAAK
jgi:hypothetical protein